MKNLKINTITWVASIGIGLVGIFSIAVSGTVGRRAGTDFGTAVGVGVGSFKSVQEFSEAYDEGTSKALEVKDTEVSVSTGLDGEGQKLQVLVGKTTVQNLLTFTNETFKWDYKELEKLSFEIVFTVDLSKAKVSQGSVVIPEPEMSLYNDESAREVIGRYNGLAFGGSAEDGFDISLNSMKELMKNSKEKLANYDELFSQAKDSARVQVANLYSSLSTDGSRVEVSFFASDSEEG